MYRLSDKEHPQFRPLLSIYGHCYDYWFTLYSAVYNTVTIHSPTKTICSPLLTIK